MHSAVRQVVVLGAPKLSVKQMLARYGLLSNLALCIDFGDRDCTDLASQTLTDVSGSGNHFQRGTTSGSDATDPALNGTAGRKSANEYLSVDGGDICTPTGSPTFDDNFSKAGALYTLAAVIKLGTLGAQTIFGNYAGSNVQGITWVMQASNFLQITQYNGSAGISKGSSNPKTLAAGSWYFICHSYNEAGGATASFVMANASVTTFDGVYTSPSATSPTVNPAIMGRGGTGATTAMLTGAQLGMICVWSGAAQPRSAMTALRDACRRRWPITA